MDEKYMNILKKMAGSTAAMIAVRLGILTASTIAGVAVGKKVEEVSGNTLVAVGAGIGTTAAIDTVANKAVQPFYKSCTKSIVSSAEDIAEEMNEIRDQLSPEEMKEADAYQEKLNNFKETYNI